MTRPLWIAAAVWIVFWSLYPTFGRPRAFAAALGTGARAMDACDAIHAEQARVDCWRSVSGRMTQQLNTITLHNEYTGYAPVWLGVGVGVPCAVALAIVAMRRRRLA